MGNTQVHANEPKFVRVPADGVKVATLKEGDGTTYPMKGQRARVVYEGTTESGKPYAGTGYFPVGMGGIDKCLDSSVRNMSVGETARVTCSPDVHYQPLADVYAKQGIPHATRTFTLQLLGVKSCNSVDGC
eukprot:TRINITY_DN4134_c0_g2_i2.p1 TRINITY_DN4134_c0_g2~~TRINITY_DN4134_c0_g2_i2.p1  ORF type:complete len:131 (+),score=26.93 TRINITY_DN4134_c0_g2_i2:66-458(+)